ncbi:MAG: hypothetical protein OEZ38_01805 [Gammaproteobacteria bacterium]|nr:hypothetical protein [Gammaproteobacteria bacterium]
MNHFKFFIVIAACISILYGCSNATNGKVTGGGTIVSASGNGKANFGFNGDSCTGKVKGKFNFHDKYHNADKGGVKLNGTVTGTDHCIATGTGARYSGDCTQCANGYIVKLNYKSTNPKIPGTGEAIACVVDNGQGMKATSSDSIWVKATSGPYSGYFSKGNVQGNIKGHACDS